MTLEFLLAKTQDLKLIHCYLKLNKTKIELQNSDKNGRKRYEENKEGYDRTK